MSDSIRIRRATEADAAALLAIYRPFVEASAISFETIVPTVEEFAARIRKALTGWQWLVAEEDGQSIGYAYGSSHRERAAYRWSTEVSAYVAPNSVATSRSVSACVQIGPRVAVHSGEAGATCAHSSITSEPPKPRIRLAHWPGWFS